MWEAKGLPIIDEAEGKGIMKMTPGYTTTI